MRRFPRGVRVASLVAALGVASAGARGEVVDATDAGFTVRSVVTVSAPPAKAYASLVDIGRWWDPAHTYSGSASNLTIEARPDGCFCERLPGGGGVRHMSVVFAAPGTMLRLSGALGPLQESGLAGTMTWKFQAAGAGTTVTLEYVVGGYRPGGLKALAPVIDAVLHEQIERYKRYVETGTP